MYHLPFSLGKEPPNVIVDAGRSKDEKETPSIGTPEKHQSLEYQGETPAIGTPIIISQYAGDAVERLTQAPIMNEPEPEKIRTFTNIMDFLRLRSKIITG